MKVTISKGAVKTGFILAVCAAFILSFYLMYPKFARAADFSGSGAKTVTYTPSSETHCTNGVCTETLYLDYKFFVNSSGMYEAINGTPEYGNFNGYDYRVIKGFYNAYYKSHLSYGDSIMFCGDNYCFTMQPSKLTYRNPSNSNDDIFSSPNTTNIGYPSENSFNWNDVFGNYDLSYQYFPTSLKESLALDDKPRTPSTSLGNVSLVTMDIDTYIKYPVGVDLYFVNGTKITGNIITSERLEFRNSTNSTLYSLPEPYAYDANGSGVMLNYQIIWDKKYNQGQQRLLWFYIKTPYDWLNSSERVYPIYVDPTVLYNFTYVNTNRAYTRTADIGTGSAGANDFSDPLKPTVAEVYAGGGAGAPVNMTQNAYVALQLNDTKFANLTSGAPSDEPYAYFNFTLNGFKNFVTSVTVDISQGGLGLDGSPEFCNYTMVNFTNNDVFDFGSITANSNTKKTLTISSASEIAKIIDPSNRLTVVAYGTNAESGEGCQVDYVNVTVVYTSVVTFTSPANNNTNARPNDYVNFTTILNTSDPTLSAYRFSSNFTGSWQNSSWISLTSQASNNITAWNVSTAPTAGIYGWKFFANSSLNFSNVSAEQNFNFSTKVLMVNWTNANNGFSQINATTCTQGLPCAYNYNATSYNYLMNVSGNVTCKTTPSGQSCGSLTGGVMYNTSSAYDWINTTADAIPFYMNATATVGVTYNYSRPQVWSSGGSSGGSVTNPGYAIDLNYNDITTYANLTAPTNGQYYLNYTFNVSSGWNATSSTFNISITNSRDEIGYYSLTACYGLSGDGIFAFNFQTNTFKLLGGVLPTFLHQDNITLNSTYLNGTNHGILSLCRAGSSSTAGSRYYYDIFITLTLVGQNPSSLSTLASGQSYLLNYTINATDNKDYKLIFNFTSNGAPNPPENVTPVAYITNTTAGGPPVENWVAITPSETLIKGVQFGSINISTIYAAFNNSNSPAGGTLYNITVDPSSDQSIDFYNRLNATITGTTITESSSITSETGGFIENITLTTSWAVMGNSTHNCTKVAIDENCWEKFYVETTSSAPTGFKEIEFWFCGVKTGDGSGACHT